MNRRGFLKAIAALSAALLGVKTAQIKPLPYHGARGSFSEFRIPGKRIVCWWVEQAGEWPDVPHVSKYADASNTWESTHIWPQQPTIVATGGTHTCVFRLSGVYTYTVK